MWKVKRMNTARIVVLTIAVGTGGVVTHLAGGSDNRSPPARPAAQRQTGDSPVAAILPATKPEPAVATARLRQIADVGPIGEESDHQALRRRDGITVFRGGVPDMTGPKGPKGRST
jgi:hypothetical protein